MKPATDAVEIPVWDASLSTMWGLENFQSLEDFFSVARQLGFAKIELNHHVDSAMLAGIKLSQYSFSSIHEPCPADISTESLRERDWLISSANESCRQQGVKAIRHSIDLARQLHVPVVVLHAGDVKADTRLEKQLRALIKEGKRQSEEYQAILKRLESSRLELGKTRFDAVKKSLLELLEYAGRNGVRLGLENRFHYLDIPSLDEMGILLNLAGPEQLGVIYDTGHALVLDRLGFYPYQEWLEHYAARIIGLHLHDVIGINDHYAAGLGGVDFETVSAYLPERAFRTCEYQGFNSLEQIKSSLKRLADCGCIKPMREIIR